MRFWICLLCLFVAVAPVAGEPCFIPPSRVPEPGAVQAELIRTGVQRTYIFHHGSVEDIVVQPSLAGRNLSDFGIVLPFPEPPAIRKVDPTFFDVLDRLLAPAIATPSESLDMTLEAEGLERGEVRVIEEKIVGMYQVATLEAGDADALVTWLETNDYRYPAGMAPVAQEYVERGWVFVAVKVNLAAKSTTDPRPGQNTVEPALPRGSFRGPVQAMGFRFHSPELVLYAKLASFNDRSRMTSRLYLVTDEPVRIRQFRPSLVREHVPVKSLIKRGRHAGGAVVLNTFCQDLHCAMGGELKPTNWEEKANDLVAELEADFVLTVVEGEFPVDVLRSRDLTTEPVLLNQPDVLKAAGVEPGAPSTSPRDGERNGPPPMRVFLVVLAVLVSMGVVASRLRRRR